VDDPDPRPTAIVIDGPSPGDTVFHLVQVELSVTPADAAGTVTLLVDGIEVASSDLSGGVVAFDWDSTTVSDGSHTLGVSAADADGNALVDQITVEVANDAGAGERLDVIPARGRDGSRVCLARCLQPDHAVAAAMGLQLGGREMRRALLDIADPDLKRLSMMTPLRGRCGLVGV
jgi:hypothetical protein